MMLVLIAIGVVSTSAPNFSSPPIEEVHRAALDYAHIEMKDATDWKKRAKISALLPRLQFDYMYRVKELVDVNIKDNVYVGSSDVVVGPEEGTYSENSDLYQTFGIRAVWSLNELIFTHDSLDVSRQVLNVVQQRNSLLEAVNKYYFERKKLVGEIMSSEDKKSKGQLDKKETEELPSKYIALEKATASLDALTGGWFSRVLSN